LGPGNSEEDVEKTLGASILKISRQVGRLPACGDHAVAEEAFASVAARKRGWHKSHAQLLPPPCNLCRTEGVLGSRRLVDDELAVLDLCQSVGSVSRLSAGCRPVNRSAGMRTASVTLSLD
jgi:hypothetical protein